MTNTNNRPKVIDDLTGKMKEVMDRNNSPVLTTKEACEILGCKEENLLNAASCGCLPFGFIHKKGETFRRTLVVEKLALFNWLTKGTM